MANKYPQGNKWKVVAPQNQGPFKSGLVEQQWFGSVKIGDCRGPGAGKARGGLGVNESQLTRQKQTIDNDFSTVLVSPLKSGIKPKLNINNCHEWNIMSITAHSVVPNG